MKKTEKYFIKFCKGNSWGMIWKETKKEKIFGLIKTIEKKPLLVYNFSLGIAPADFCRKVNKKRKEYLYTDYLSPLDFSFQNTKWTTTKYFDTFDYAIAIFNLMRNSKEDDEVDSILKDE